MPGISFDRRLPAPERAQFIVDAARKGHKARQITIDLVGSNRRDARWTVDRILADVDAFDTHIDDVAVTRAYQGDKPVWGALTRYERKACLDLVMDRALAGRTHMCWPGVPALANGAEPGWVGLWAVAVGERPQRLVDILQARRVAAKEHANAN